MLYEIPINISSEDPTSSSELLISSDDEVGSSDGDSSDDEVRSFDDEMIFCIDDQEDWKKLDEEEDWKKLDEEEDDDNNIPVVGKTKWRNTDVVRSDKFSVVPLGPASPQMQLSFAVQPLIATATGTTNINGSCHWWLMLYRVMFQN